MKFDFVARQGSRNLHMRLMHTSTFELHDFITAPVDAILSYTWGTEEVTYQDIVSCGSLLRVNKQGHEKLVCCYQKVASDGFDFVWVDACCI